MAGRSTAVYGVYANRDLVEGGIAELKRAGFRNTDLALMMPQSDGPRDLAFVRATKAPEGATLGAVVGAIVGGLLGWFAAIGGFLPRETFPAGAAWPVAAVLAGIAVVGIAGGIVGALAGAVRPEYEARRYNGRLRRGGILLSVHCDAGGWEQKARKILRDTGALRIASGSEARADYQGAEPPERVRTAGDKP